MRLVRRRLWLVKRPHPSFSSLLLFLSFNPRERQAIGTILFKP
jgi:hypothetical protein